jgi:putative redox protein
MTGKTSTSVHVEWAGDGRFDASRQGGPPVRIDTSGETGLGPVDTLLSALAGCASVDVVEILAKRRTPVSALSVDVAAERFDGVPRRVVKATLHFTIAGDGIDRVHAERAIDLSINKYCSVRDSLREDTIVDWTLTLEPSPASTAAA